jgi:UDP-N-acetylglucosamine 2-epimerase (non-hydrolysing)
LEGQEVKVLLVAAARPNFMKVAPVLRALEARGVDGHLLHTGQHYDESMSDTFFKELDIRTPDTHLAVGSGSHAEVTARVMLALEPVLRCVAPDIVVVVGDVNSTLACALVASKLMIPVAHVESGLRSQDRSMPEELNRLCTDQLSDWLFTTSSDADDNLRAEGFAQERIFLVGNVMIDTLVHNRHRVDAGVLVHFGVQHRDYVLLTLHRPSNVDDVAVLDRLLSVAEEIAEDVPVLFPVHPRTRRRLDELDRQLTSGIRLLEPLGYMNFLGLMDHARVVLTDSGGIQEETTVMGVPCLTLRESTERPVTVTAGSNHVVGTDPSRILRTYRSLASDATYPRPELWDGRAADRIADVLLSTAPPLAALRRSRV